MKTQLKRLPNGTYVVEQTGYKHRNGWAKYAVYSKTGWMILLSNRESNIKEVRKSALNSLNGQVITRLYTGR